MVKVGSKVGNIVGPVITGLPVLVTEASCYDFSAGSYSLAVCKNEYMWWLVDVVTE